MEGKLTSCPGPVILHVPEGSVSSWTCWDSGSSGAAVVEQWWSSPPLEAVGEPAASSWSFSGWRKVRLSGAPLKFSRVPELGSSGPQLVLGRVLADVLVDPGGSDLPAGSAAKENRL